MRLSCFLKHRILTDRWQRSRGNQKYYAYGRTRQQSGYMPTDYTFTGQKQDATGLIYMNARYYDPQIGAFISPDTIVPDPTNLFDYERYMYARGNPLKYIDPTGHDPCDNGSQNCSNNSGIPFDYIQELYHSFTYLSGNKDYTWGMFYNDFLKAYHATGDLNYTQIANLMSDAYISQYGDASGNTKALFILSITPDNILAYAVAQAHNERVDEFMAVSMMGGPAFTPFGSGKGTHKAQVTVVRNGKVVYDNEFVSGNMTSDEAALGFPRSTLATHTEYRAVNQVPLESGDIMTIKGQYPPCPSCKGAMNRAAKANGATIIYIWPGGQWSAKK